MDNADLEKLKISPGKLLPKFKASVCEYSVTVASSVGEVKLSPLTSDSGASCIVQVGSQRKSLKQLEITQQVIFHIPPSRVQTAVVQ